MCNTGLLVVDVQPAYAGACDTIAAKVAQRINNTKKPVTVMWVGEGITRDTEDDVRDYLHHHGARPGKLGQVRFIEKDYGFFRSWMDAGVSSEHIVRVGQEMLRRRVHCSDDLPEEVRYGMSFTEADGSQPYFPETIPEWDPLTWPSFSTAPLQGFDGFETCGGGDQECLAEIELWLQMTRKPYRRLEQLVY